jgi:hypothetical protein
MNSASRPIFERSLLLLFAIVSVWVGPAMAHSMYQSAVLLDFRGNTVNAELQLPVDRLSISFRQTVDEEHYPAERTALKSYVLAHVYPVTADGKHFSVQFVSMAIATVEKAPYLVVHLVFTPPPGASADLFTLNYDVITHEIVTHVVLVSIRSDSNARIPPNDPLLIGVIRAERKSLVVDRMRIL